MEKNITNSGIRERVNLISQNKNLTLNTPRTTSKLELVGSCTLSCSFCANSSLTSRHKKIDQYKFERMMEHLAAIPTMKEVGLFYMGESGLHPLLARYYERVKSLRYFTYLTTNGTMRDTIIEAIPYIDSLKVSWNYKNLDDFKKKTGRDSKTYFSIAENIFAFTEECHKYGKALTISTVLDSNPEDYKNTIAALHFDENYYIPLQTQGGNFDKGSPGVIGEFLSPVKPLPCWSLFKGAYIDCNLDVRTCCYGHTKEHVLFNLEDDKYDYTKLNDAKAQQLRGEIPSFCKRCLGGR